VLIPYSIQNGFIYLIKLLEVESRHGLKRDSGAIHRESKIPTNAQKPTLA
jgi:hypothetical protein